MSANMSRGMIKFFPILTFVIAISLPGAVVLYYAVQAAVAVGQQALILHGDKEEIAKIANQPASKQRSKKAQEAVVVMKKSDLKKQAASSPANHSNGQTVVRRIKAK
jgi:membrane protein insertase Oxa1/YidC/SpoIIIJ